jgi:hypothetical protein
MDKSIWEKIRMFSISLSQKNPPPNQFAKKNNTPGEKSSKHNKIQNPKKQAPMTTANTSRRE